DFLGTLGVRIAHGDVAIGNILPDGAAARDGLRAGDLIRSIDGVLIERAAQVIEAVQASAGKALRIAVLRDGAEVTLSVTPQLQEGVGRIGAGLQDRLAMQTVRYGPLDSIGHGVRQTWEMSAFSLRMMGKMITGELS